MLNRVVRRDSSGPRAAADPPSAELASCGPVAPRRVVSDSGSRSAALNPSTDGGGTRGIPLAPFPESCSTRFESSRTHHLELTHFAFELCLARRARHERLGQGISRWYGAGFARRGHRPPERVTVGRTVRLPFPSPKARSIARLTTTLHIALYQWYLPLHVSFKLIIDIDRARGNDRVGRERRVHEIGALAHGRV